MVELLGLGGAIIMKADDNELILEFFPDLLSLALKVKIWAKTTIQEFEGESEEDQNAQAVEVLLDSTYLFPAL